MRNTNNFSGVTGLCAALLSGAISVAGCTGNVGSPGTGPGSTDGIGSGGTGGNSGSSGGAGNAGAAGRVTPGVPVAVPPSAPGKVPLRRLTIREYKNSIRDLLGIADVSTKDLAVDQPVAFSGYSAGAAITSAPDVRVLLDKAEQFSTAGMARVATLVPCITTPTAADACARQFVEQFGRRAFRRPLIEEEVVRLLALYTAQRSPDIGADFSGAIRSVVTAILQSPNFLYRHELGPVAPLRDGNLVRFNPHEMASQLSYALWASMPDDRLFQQADAGKLQSPADIQAEAKRMMVDPKAKEGYSDFSIQWLNLTQLPYAQKDPSLNFTDQVAQSMLKETGEFVSDLFLGPKATGSLDALFTSRTSFVDQTLAGIYGLPGVTGTAMTPVTFDAKQRSGILTQASFLTMHGAALGSFPVRRGAQIVRRLFCTDVELPLNVVVTEPPPAVAGETTRQRFAKHSENACATCHKVFDPLGFAFENYDGLGRYRTTDNGQPVDASGSLTLSYGFVSFNNATELVSGLAKDEQVQDCVATQWTRYFLRRKEEPGDMASLMQAQSTFRSSALDMRELLVAIATSDSFAKRTPAVDEVMQ
jgi:hypothetical protein